MTEVTNPVDENAVDETPVQLSLGDLGAVVRIIDVCAERGAFKGAELVTVGTIRARFADFLEQAAPQAEQAEQAPEFEEVAEV